MDLCTLKRTLNNLKKKCDDLVKYAHAYEDSESAFAEINIKSKNCHCLQQKVEKLRKQYYELPETLNISKEDEALYDLEEQLEALETRPETDHEILQSQSGRGWINMAFMFFFPLLLVAKVSSGFDCPEEWIDCGNGNCIADIYRCDGDNDCGNFRDEQNCDNLPPKKCQSSQFQCLESGHCILETWRCDGERDCEDGSDEHTCDNLPPKKCQSSQFQCLESGHCILETWRCDGERDCEDGSDEHTCAPKTCGSGKFQCKIGVCIDQVMVCDRRKDCEDGSDEMNCTQANATCKAGRYACRDGVGCIYEHEVCDGHKDCSRGEDETNCTVNVSLDCTSEEYLCSNTSRCSPRRWICDGDDDCGDRSDKPTDCIDVVEPVIRYKDAIS
ncbi:unnamed protein product [Larinioides sclopetarius]|uniref:Uncharacterized protein n=1 Tax=Larinioides sclopetarius TaxID=280406 RepID=A0AAV2BFW2_9ARAC